MACSGSPRRIYRAYSNAQLQALFDSLVQAQIEGRFTSLSGQGHSSQSEFGDMESQLFEVTYEMGVRGMNGVVNPPNKVYMNFNEQIPPNEITVTV